ncbi:MAG: DVU_1553 family AMP-dependent CoA ligase [Acidobacteriaceae bacterium]
MTSAALDPNPLDLWASQRTGIAPEELSCEAVAEYQLRAIRQTVAWARSRSSFYAARLAAFPKDWPRSFEEFRQAPLTGPADLVDRAHEFLCVPQREISRVVSLESSGTSGPRKRIFFTAEDQNLTLEFFARGVATMAAEIDRMLIALPGEREGSVGFQLACGIARVGVTPIPHGFSLDPAATLRRMDEERATLLIGLPVQVLAIALERSELARRVFRRLHTVVLCSDHVPRNLTDRIRDAIDCGVFEHYGSTEMGLGGGIDCRAHAGYHLREADLYFEIVSSQTGEPLPDGEPGEVVFTTLGRLGMPLLRYRTGDRSRILPGPCSCGSPLRRLARVCSRIDGAVALGAEGSITLADLDEALFAIPGVYDFSAALVPGKPQELQVRLYAPQADAGTAAQAERALQDLPAIDTNTSAGALLLSLSLQDKPFPVTGAKRMIRVETTP